jgi:hypothetical protein
MDFVGAAVDGGADVGFADGDLVGTPVGLVVEGGIMVGLVVLGEFDGGVLVDGIGE